MTLSWVDHHNTQNVDTFTARDYQVELLATAFERNLVLCMDPPYHDFISLKLVTELAPELRRNHQKCVLYMLNDISKAESIAFIAHLTDLQVAIIDPTPAGAQSEPPPIDTNAHILISTPETFLKHLESAAISMNHVSLLILDNCHLQIGLTSIETIVEKFYAPAEHKPRILGLSDSIHGVNCPSNHLEVKLQYLERCLRSTIETANDVHNTARLAIRPHEFLIETPVPLIDPLTSLIAEIIRSKISLLEEHRFAPLEIYSDEFVDDWKNVPDPKLLPLSLLHEFLDILLDLGPFTAKKAALHFIVQIEKFKIKVAYERHFLLLSFVSAAFHQVRMLSDYFFRDVEFKDQIANYTTPKVQNLLRILRQFKPKSQNSSAEGTNGNGSGGKSTESSSNNSPPQSTETPVNLSETTKEIVSGLDELNFKSLAEAIDQQVVHQEEKKALTNGIGGGGEVETELEAEAQEVKAALKSLTTTTQRGTTNGKGGGTEGPRPMRTRKRYFNRHRGFHNNHQQDNDSLCGVIFCESKNIAKALFSVVHEAALHDPELKYLSVQYTTEKCQSVDVVADVKEIETEHRKQEEVLKRFRSRECNLLISTPMLESGIDLPKCNLVVRWNVPKSYKSYMQTKGKANAVNAFHLIMVSSRFLRNGDAVKFEGFSEAYHDTICCPAITETGEDGEETEKVNIPKEVSQKGFQSWISNPEILSSEVAEQLAEYYEVEKILSRSREVEKCTERSSTLSGVEEAELYNDLVRPYKAKPTSACSATLLNSVHLINNYCAKLPSDTFTKLVPLVRYAKTTRQDVTLHQCTIRLPINSPLKCDIVGLPAPTKSLASRIAALIGCRMLHQSGELDENLQPIGKEEFRASEAYFKNFELDQTDHQLVKENAEPRPGTTKRRQYYYKKIASVLKDCRPTAGCRTYLYHIRMVLRTPIPEEQNTRGRRIFAPEDCPLGFGILTTKKLPKLCSFPIFTRSGEIEVSLELSDDCVMLQEEDIQKVNHFIRFTFTNVLRLQKYLMFFDESATENCLYVAPTIEGEDGRVRIDWKFLDVINEQPSSYSRFKSDEERKGWQFDEATFQDAVVMPWYRNQDQPQYFYVAEICKFLSPESNFPGTSYATFKEYYFKKYNIEVQNIKQPLLDVDHTSARLNFLTPRYVNRKGVALPTSSEETKRAKRENLEQKQILIPELCTIHPFPASLWRAAVCLPCILYRINALLLADEIRIQVAKDLGLGQMDIGSKEWPILNFGWSLHELMRGQGLERRSIEGATAEEEKKEFDGEEEKLSELDETKSEVCDDEEELEGDEEDGDKLEIGMWNNEMAKNLYDTNDGKMDKLVRYGSPTQWDSKTEVMSGKVDHYFSDSDSSFASDEENEDHRFPGNNNYNHNMNSGGNVVECFDRLDEMKLRIKFESNNVAEAFESEATIANRNKYYYQPGESEASEPPFEITHIENSPYFHPELIAEFGEKKCRMVEEVRRRNLIKSVEELDLSKYRAQKKTESERKPPELLHKLFPYLTKAEIEEYLTTKGLDGESPKLTIDNWFELNELYYKLHPGEQDQFKVSDCGDVFNRFEGSARDMGKESGEEREISVTFTRGDIGRKIPEATNRDLSLKMFENNFATTTALQPVNVGFSFDYQPDLNEHPGPSPSIILQALTMSNANDGINLERLETIGDSFLKFAITTYLYCTYENVHEGKLSHLRSKYVSNLNLYRLGRLKNLGELMISTKFEPHDNWLPPCYYTPRGLEKVLIEAQIPIFYWNLADLRSLKEKSNYEICDLILKRAMESGFVPQGKLREEVKEVEMVEESDGGGLEGDKVAIEAIGMTGAIIEDNVPCFIPYNLVNQHSIPDKSIADCVEALIGSYLIECGPRGALLFMSWAGICVLPHAEIEYPAECKRYPGSGELIERDGKVYRKVYGSWKAPKSPSAEHKDFGKSFDYELEGFKSFEEQIGYTFNDPLYLLQSMTHASYSPNRLTDCYQRLEFLGDAVLDYLITRHLFEDPRQHSPGALTDLRSALVNNTIFASLAVRHGFHKHFRHLSSGLHEVIDRFVRIQHENGYTLSEECYLILEDELEEAEDVEVPKALGDLFESVAGAIFLDSGMSLDAVWRVYEKIMRPEIEKFSSSVPKSPIRELLELEPETAKFGKPEKLADGRRVRVVVEIFGKGTFHGIGRNYRIAKCTAAKCALRHLKRTKC